MDPAIVIPILAAILTPIGAYLVAARRMSGKIKTTDAGDLWKEAGSIRDDYKDRIEVANSRILDLETRLAKLDGANNELYRENLRLQSKIGDLENLVRELQSEIAQLRGGTPPNQVKETEE